MIRGHDGLDGDEDGRWLEGAVAVGDGVASHGLTADGDLGTGQREARLYRGGGVGLTR